MLISPVQDGSGDCSELSCTTCPTTSTSDNSACVGCGNSTMGVGASGDCACDFSAGEVGFLGQLPLLLIYMYI